MSDWVNTISNRSAYAPIIESLIIEHLIVVLSPIVTFGPMIELLIEQPGAILTGGTIMVFSNVCSLEILPPNFFINMAFDPRTVSEQTIEDFIDRMKLPNAKYAFMSTMLGIRNTPNLSSRLDKILSPTIIVWGEQDEMIPVKYADDYKKIPKSNLIVVPKCGHTPFTEKPEIFSKIAIDFLR